MKAGKVYTVGRDTGNYLISKGLAILIDDEVAKEDPAKVVGGTVPPKPAEAEQKIEQTASDILQAQIEAKTKQFKEASNKDDKKRLRKEINELKAKINE